LDGQKIKRDVLKLLLSPLVRWSPLRDPKPGFSIVLGSPWALHHLLPVNLEFVAKTDLQHLHRLHIVFDRTVRDGADSFIKNIKSHFPQLPLTFRFHSAVAGSLVQRINQSKFYASMNWTLGIAQCETRYAVMHDFDLYPLVPHYFSAMVDALRNRALKFSGVEYTTFDGLQPDHRLIGTWALAIDVAWLRQNYRPIDCFHAVEHVAGRRFDLDAFSHIQSKTQQRDLANTVNVNDMAHVRNLVSTYLRFSKGQHFDLVWRLHHMWYLESLSAPVSHLPALTDMMDQATSAQLIVHGQSADFAGTHVTCANVLREQVTPMEIFLHGTVRPEVKDYLAAFERFLWKYGKTDPILSADGSLVWDPKKRQGTEQS